MPDAPVEIERVGEVTVLRITAGSLLDQDTLARVGDEFDRVVLGMGRCRLVIDLSKVKHMSSSAISLFLTAHKNVESANGRMVIRGVAKPLLESFKITGLGKMFEFYKSTNAACRSYSSHKS